MAAVLTPDNKLEPDWTAFLSQVDDVAVQSDKALVFTPASSSPDVAESYAYSTSKPVDAVYNSSGNAATFGTTSAHVGDGNDGLLLSYQGLNAKTDLGKMLVAFGILKDKGSETKQTVINTIVKAAGLDSAIVVDAGPKHQPNRNGVWLLPLKSPVKDVPNALQPLETLQIATSLSFKLDGTVLKDFLEKVAGTLNDEFGTSLKAPDIVPPDCFSFRLVQTTTGTKISDNTFEIDVDEQLIFFIKLSGFIVSIKHQQTGVSLSVQEDFEALGDMFTKMKNLMATAPDTESPGTSVDALSSTAEFGDTGIHLWDVTFARDFDGLSWWRSKFAVQWTVNGQIVWIGLSYDSRQKMFVGELLFRRNFPDGAQALLPFFDASQLPPGGAVLPDNLDLYLLFNETTGLPAEIPHIFTLGSISLMHQSKPATFSLSIALESSSVSDASGELVPAPFDWRTVVLDITKAGPKVTVHVDSSAQLNPLPEDAAKFTPAQMAISLDYDSGSYNLFGNVENLQFGALAHYADPACSSAFAFIFGNLTLSQLSLRYTVDKTDGGGKASSFLLLGKIRLGLLELDLVYQYASSIAKETATQRRLDEDPNALGKTASAKVAPITKPAKDSTWTFEAYLGAANTTSSLRDVVASIDSDVGDALPGFVGDIEIKPAGNDASPISLKLSKKTNKSGTDGEINASVAGTQEKSDLLLTLRVALGPIDVTIVQISDNGSKTKDATGKDVVKRPVPKRLIRIKIGSLPKIESVPIVQELTQPFQSLQYIYVGDGGAFTTDDMNAVNKQLGDDNKVFYKETNKKDDSASGETAKAIDALVPGHHFMVVHNDKVILDHVFHNAKSTAPPEKDGGDQGSNTVSPPTTDPDKKPDPKPDPGSEPAPTKGALKAQTKLLTIDSVALQFKDGILWIMLDATVALGPVALTLLGFGVGLPLSDASLAVKPTLDNLGTIAGHLQFQIHGLGVSFEKPPLVLAGVFEHEIMTLLVGDPPKSETIDAYRGGIGISFPPYTFVAVGQYAKVTMSDGHQYKSFFVFAKLDGPLIQLEFGGVRIGFGYNSMVRSPSIEELTDFPLISDGSLGGAGNNPIKLLQALCKGTPPWVAPKEDSYWFAIGMTITAFDILKITAAALLAFRDSGIVVSLYADAVAQMPPGVTSTSEMILYVEIGLVAEINFVDSFMRCEASLAPTSFLLVPQCHLYGGFALVYWFGNNPHAGDWVFSVGGYHRAFQKPSHYPEPKRLGISFTVGDMVQITGEGYFAITPKCVMGGAMIHVSLSVGIVSAFLDASFDALINFHPIHYQADLHVAIGVSCDIDILFIHIHISITVGADLHIEGPEFGGVAHVDFWVCGFDVYFGEHGNVPPPLTLDEFYDMVHKAGPITGQPPASGPEADNIEQQIKLSMESGNFPMPSKDKAATAPDDEPDSTGVGSKWFVKGGSFAFRLAPDFAITKALVATDESVAAKTAKNPKYADLMAELPRSTDPSQATAPLRSTPMHVDASMNEIASQLEVTIRSAGGKQEVVPGWTIKYIIKDVPSALWRAYSTDLDPMLKGSAGELLKPDGGTVKQLMGISVQAPDPVLAPSLMPPFNATDAQKSEVLNDKGESWTIPTPGADQKAAMLPTALNPAETAKDDPTQWADMKKTWEDSSKAGLTLASDIAALCASTLGWNKPMIGTSPDASKPLSIDKPTWQLDASLPLRLVAGTAAGQVPLNDIADGLQNFYLALPRVGVAA